MDFKEIIKAKIQDLLNKNDGKYTEVIVSLLHTYAGQLKNLKDEPAVQECVAIYQKVQRKEKVELDDLKRVVDKLFNNR